MFEIRQISRKPRHACGDLNVRRAQPIDAAAWIWFPGCGAENPFLPKPRSFRFRRAFDSDGSALRFDVSADERFVLFLDGRIVARGPDRAGSIQNWTYQSFEVTALRPGPHLMEAVCWTHWEKAPRQQLTWRGGFVLQAEGFYESRLSTGTGEDEASQWEVGELLGTTLYNGGASCWGGGLCVDSAGCGLVYEQPASWTKAEIVRGPAGSPNRHIYGIRTNGWILYPTPLPAQIERRIAPGEFKSAMDKFGGEDDAYTAEGASHPLVAAFNALLREGRRLVVPPRTAASLCWDLGDYYAAYPQLAVSGGKGALVAWGWAEGLYDEKRRKLNRAEFAGRRFLGTWDRFRPDGRAGAVFSTQWWRCGRWCEIKVETADEPLEIETVALDETRYPLEREGSFACDDETLGPVQAICTRVMQQCAHETLFDGPFYEQQMYPGDTRVQLLVLSALSRDDRMIRRAIELFDYGQRDGGMAPMNWPTTLDQESATYTQCWLLMFGDYVRYHDNFDWLRARVPAMRHALSALETHADADGLLRDLPGWSFMDWVARWPTGVCPSSFPGDPPAALVNLFHTLDLQAAADVERALGDEPMARAWESRLPRLKAKILELFWDEGRGMLADTVAHDEFSEHAQCLGVISGVLEGRQAQTAIARMVAETDPAFARCTVYFSHYLFDAYFRAGRPDLFLRRLDLWRGYVASGLSTTLECPEEDGAVSRSDCHAWGAHPLYWMQTGLAGVRPAAPGFAKVLVSPAPGPLAFVKCKAPHPGGFVVVDLSFADGRAAGLVTLPEGVCGDFEFGGRRQPLVSGENRI